MKLIKPLFIVMILVFAGCEKDGAVDDETSQESNASGKKNGFGNEGDDYDDETYDGCYLTTDCEKVELEFKGRPEFEISSKKEGDEWTIKVYDSNDNLIYDKKCDKGGDASIECDRGSGG